MRASASLIQRLISKKYKNKVKLLELIPIKTATDFNKWIANEIKKQSFKKRNIRAVLEAFTPALERFNIKNLLTFLAVYFKRKMIYTRELPDLEVVNVDLAYILQTPRFQGDCDDATYLIGTILLILNRYYGLGLKISVVFTSHHAGKPLHHAYLGIKDKKGASYIIDIVRKHKRKLPVFSAVNTFVN